MTNETNLFKVPVFASEFDLADPNLKVAIEKLGMEAVLINCFGFDENESFEGGKFYEELHCEHRQRLYPFSVNTGIRYSGIERLDKEWIKTGLASEEAKLSAKNDNSLLQELRKMGG